MPFVSGINIVDATPESMKNANISRLWQPSNQYLSNIICAERYPHVLHEFVRPSDIFQPREANLRDDCPELPGRCRYTMCGAPVPGRERLARRHTHGRIGPEVREEIAQAVQEDKHAGTDSARAHGIVAEAHDDEQNGEHGKPASLYRLASNAVNGKDAEVCARDLSSDGQNQVSDADVAQVLVNSCCACDGWRWVAKPDCVENDSGVEAQTIERNLSELAW